ncbi:MAG: hypothetical protein WCL44_10460 [bacterium]
MTPRVALRQGWLTGWLSASGLVAIRAGGILEGELVGHRLAVEDGAGVTASIDTSP